MDLLALLLVSTLNNNTEHSKGKITSLSYRDILSLSGCLDSFVCKCKFARQDKRMDSKKPTASERDEIEDRGEEENEEVSKILLKTVVILAKKKKSKLAASSRG